MASASSIVLLTHEYAPFRGGAATYVHEIATAATQAGIEAEVWAPDRGMANQDAGEFPVKRLRSRGRLGPAGVASLILALARERRALDGRPVILLSAGAHMAWAALQDLLPSRQVTAFFHGSEIFKFERSVLWRPATQRLYARARGVAVASRFVEGLVRGSVLVGSERPLQFAPCAVPGELDRMAQQPSAEAAFARLRVLTVARLHPRKGQVELANALGQLGRPVVYQMVGTGEASYQREIAAACQRAGVEFEFTGAVGLTALAAAYRACDIYAQSSRTLARSVEGFGISYLEAAAFGKPCVGVRTGGVGEAVIDGVTGLLAPEGDMDALAGCLNRLAADASLRDRMGVAGRKHAASFSWETSARALCAFAAETLDPY